MSLIEHTTPGVDARSSKAHGAVLRALQGDLKQVAIGVAMGINESAVSRLQTKELGPVIQFLYHLGFKVVPSDYQCVPEVQARAWFDSHVRELEHMKETKKLWATE